MRAFASLTLFVVLSGGASAAPICEFIECPLLPNGNAPAILYYVIMPETPLMLERHEYIRTGPAGVAFDDLSGTFRRVVHEVRVPIVEPVCQQDRNTFETEHGVSVGPVLSGELREVLNSNGNRVGTVFFDRGMVGTRAVQGGIAIQETYRCGQPTGPDLSVLENVSLLHSAFDVNGIDGATPQAIQTQYLGLIRQRLFQAAHDHMANEPDGGCTVVTYGQYSDRCKLTGQCEQHFDTGDPTPILIGIPSE
jgi:hypothetical protein